MFRPDFLNSECLILKIECITIKFETHRVRDIRESRKSNSSKKISITIVYITIRLTQLQQFKLTFYIYLI
jgi:hypothetical protein